MLWCTIDIVQVVKNVFKEISLKFFIQKEEEVVRLKLEYWVTVTNFW